VVSADFESDSHVHKAQEKSRIPTSRRAQEANLAGTKSQDVFLQKRKKNHKLPEKGGVTVTSRLQQPAEDVLRRK
jgi:hypothetical protein